MNPKPVTKVHGRTESQEHHFSNNFKVGTLTNKPSLPAKIIPENTSTEPKSSSGSSFLLDIKVPDNNQLFDQLFQSVSPKRPHSSLSNSENWKSSQPVVSSLKASPSKLE